MLLSNLNHLSLLMDHVSQENITVLHLIFFYKEITEIGLMILFLTVMASIKIMKHCGSFISKVLI